MAQSEAGTCLYFENLSMEPAWLGEGGAGVPGGGWDPCRREPRACPVLKSHSVFRNGPPATQDTMRTADRTLLACCRLGERSG